ncbi:MAG TPA: sugar ABC transporter permease [Anaerolineaceae bacterium]|nr:sugar ABC transporter permease [Anaerolineaceae bacterium]HPN51978.1 sugar ABC transporter permease [Anaerolineaceae bacterium]
MTALSVLKKGATYGGKLMAKQRRFAYASLVPILIYMGVFSLFPILWAFVLGFFSYTPIREGSWFLGLGGQNPFVGLDNYIELFFGNGKPAEVFRIAMGNTFLFTAMVVPLNLAITLPLSVILESINDKVKTVFRAIYFLPTISSSIALVIIWSYMYAPGWGLLSQIFKLVGLVPPKSWLQDPNALYMGIPLAMICVVVAHVWQDFGYNLVIFVAALQSIPKTLREAARIDGANAFQEFWYVIVPLLSRTILLASVLTMISSLQVFVIFQLLTRGGPKNQTQTMLLSIYENAFRFANNLGLSAAMSMILFIIILVLTVVQFRLLRTEWEY